LNSTSFKAFWEKNLQNIKWRHGGWGDAHCPFHNDRYPSLSVNANHGGWICRPCGLSGTPAQFAELLGVSAPNMYTHHFYHDSKGEVIYRKVKAPDKHFWIERPTGTGGWMRGMGKLKPILYRLHEVMVSKTQICIVEGEKDADRLWWEAEFEGIPFSVTSPPFGAGSWMSQYSDILRGRQVLILPDNDETGVGHAKAVFKSLWGKADGVAIIELPGLAPKEDVSDWLSKGNTLFDLIRIMNETWQWSLEKGLLRPKETTCRT
jgi:hypothetical protein